MYAQHFAIYEKQQHEMFAEHLKLAMLEKERSEKNVCLIEQVSKLKATTVDKLHFQLCQKNVHESNLNKTYLAQNREQRETDEKKILKLEKELMKLKGTKSTFTEAAKLESDKLKESLKSCRTLHMEQIQMIDVRISDQQATIKSLKSKINTLKKSLSKLQS